MGHQVQALQYVSGGFCVVVAPWASCRFLLPPSLHHLSGSAKPCGKFGGPSSLLNGHAGYNHLYSCPVNGLDVHPVEL